MMDIEGSSRPARPAVIAGLAEGPSPGLPEPLSSGTVLGGRKQAVDGRGKHGP
jgi:hypothetical protein